MSPKLKGQGSGKSWAYFELEYGMLIGKFENLGFSSRSDNLMNSLTGFSRKRAKRNYFLIAPCFPLHLLFAVSIAASGYRFYCLFSLPFCREKSVRGIIMN